MASYKALRRDAVFVMPHLSDSDIIEVLSWIDRHPGSARVEDDLRNLTGWMSEDKPHISTAAIREVLGWANEQRLYI